jgi:DNA-binding XRE family transcriptional regulator
MRKSGNLSLNSHKSNQYNSIHLLFLMPIQNNMKIAIGKQIKALRKNKGVSQEAVADYLNISQSAYSRIENGDSHSWAFYVEKICIYFQVQPEYLVATIITPKQS